METRRDFLSQILAGLGLAASSPKPDARAGLFTTYKIGPPAPTVQPSADVSRYVVESQSYRQNSAASPNRMECEIYEVPLGYDFLLESLSIYAVATGVVRVYYIRFGVWHPKMLIRDPLMMPFSIIGMEIGLAPLPAAMTFTLPHPQIFPEQSILRAWILLDAVDPGALGEVWFAGKLYPR